MLVLEWDGVVKEVFLTDGDPQYINSNRTEELFGQYLLGRGIIDQEQLTLAMRVRDNFHGHLGDALVGLKILGALSVAQHLTRQVREKLLEAFGWQSGSFAFYPGVTCSKDAAALDWDAFELLGAAAASLPAEAVREQLAPFLPFAVRPARSPAVPPEAFRQGPLLRQVCRELDGSLTVGEWLERHDQSHEHARAVLLLITTDLLRMGR